MERLPDNPALEAFALSLREATRGHDIRRPAPIATASHGRVPRPAATTRPARLDVRGVTHVAGGTTILQPVTFTADRGEVVAIAGGSGAGKSTLLDLIAGLRTPDQGAILVDGRRSTPDERTAHVGYVPQDDIIHTDLPVARSLEHTAALRLTEPDAVRRRDVARRTLDQVGLGAQGRTKVGSLSGGQRKRACIAAELLDGPDVLLLDEPTSGLDPATAADLMGQLRRLAAGGATIVMTTHSPTDLARCDRIVFLAPGGRHVFCGTPDEALRRFDVTRLDEIYELLGSSDEHVVHDHHDHAAERDHGRRRTGRSAHTHRGPGWWRQWRTSTVRTAELIVRNPLTTAILFGSPLAVIGMLAALFRPGTIDATAPGSAAQLVFWIVFSAFFFGMTYGLLQIVTERAIVERERAAGLRPSAYVAAKVAVLLPFLAVVDAAMLWTLELSGQLPDTSRSDMIALWGTLALTSAAALGVGLATSALVRTASQATLALPMLCFPQVLFAGAIVPVSQMAVVGRGLSTVLVGRWGFEAFGRVVVSDSASVEWPSTDGVSSAFAGSAATPLWVLVGIAIATTAITVRALRSR